MLASLRSETPPYDTRRARGRPRGQAGSPASPTCRSPAGPASVVARPRLRALRLGRREARRGARRHGARPRGRRRARGRAPRRARPPRALRRVRALPRRPRVDVRAVLGGRRSGPAGSPSASAPTGWVDLPDDWSRLRAGRCVEPLACVLRGAERVPRGRVLIVGNGFVGPSLRRRPRTARRRGVRGRRRIPAGRAERRTGPSTRRSSARRGGVDDRARGGRARRHRARLRRRRRRSRRRPSTAAS